ncbi:helix-turn-helix domain-containing protein [Staphylococcus capitis]|uniref:helix-turn-helix domain-containing protein n=1 Tax=Staphylococcus capitis TaxID=29388 RepID=UPI003CFCC02C
MKRNDTSVVAVSDKRPVPFKVQWERALMRRSKLPLPCIAVLAALATYANADGGSIHPSQARLADDLGVGVRTVGRWIREGLKTGWLVETRRGIGYGEISRPSVYILKIPERAIEENRKEVSGPVADQYKKESSGSIGEAMENPKEASDSVWDLVEKEYAHAAEQERTRATTGTLVQQNRQDSSDYQHNTNSSINSDNNTAQRFRFVRVDELEPEASASTVAADEASWADSEEPKAEAEDPSYTASEAFGYRLGSFHERGLRRRQQADAAKAAAERSRQGSAYVSRSW